MALDPSIILGVKSPNILSSDERMMNAFKLKSAEAENQINQLKIGEYTDKKSMADKLLAFRQSNPNATATDYANAGYYDQAKDLGAIEKTGIDNDSAKLKMQHDMADYFASSAGAVVQQPTFENALGALQSSVDKGYLTKEQAIQEFQNLPRDPEGIRQWAQKHQMGALQVKDQLPKIGTIDTGGQQQFYSQSPVSGQATITGGIDKTPKMVFTPSGVAYDENNPTGIMVGGNYTKPEKSESKPSSIQEYEYAKQQGFAGSILDYEKAKSDSKVKLRNIPAAISTAITSNKQSLAALDAAIALHEGKDVTRGDNTMVGDKEATGWKGLIPPIMLNRIDPKGTDARAQTADIGSLIIHDRSGAAVTASETPRLMPFIPTATDDNPTILKKLKRLRSEAQLEDELLNNQYNKDSGYNVPEQNNAPPKAPAGDKIMTMRDVEATAKKSGKTTQQVIEAAKKKGFTVK
jgi:hypothetical protein